MMAKYTITIKTLIDNNFDFKMDSYPIFDESYRANLNDKILKALRFEEIGAETVELWLKFLEGWFAENMDTYNWLYKANLVKIEDPLLRTKVLDTFNKDITSKQETTSNSTQNKTNNFKSQSQQDTTNETLQETSNNVDLTGSLTSVNTGETSQDSQGSNNSKTYNSEFPQGNLGNGSGDGDTGVGDSAYYTSGSKTNNASTDKVIGTSKENNKSDNTQKTVEAGTAKQNLTGNVNNSSSGDSAEDISGQNQGSLQSEGKEKIGMEIEYQRLTEKELDNFIDMRIHQLREEGAAEDIDLVPALKDYYQRHMSEGTFVSWIALDGTTMIGTSGMSFVEKPPYFGCPSGKIGLLSSMYTDPDYRRKGIAKELLSRVIKDAKEYGCGTIQITASEMGVKLYTDFGFVHNENFMQYKL